MKNQKEEMMSKSIDDILDELEAKPKTIFEQIERWYWSFHHWIGFGSIWRFKPKFIWQHITRGFPEHHLWGLDYHLAEHIAPRLRAFADYKLHGYPCEYEDDIEEGASFYETIIEAERHVIKYQGE